jgi:sugar-phosphatase
MLELFVPDSHGGQTLACDAVLFDMDGTLVDSTSCVEATWRGWAERHGLDFHAFMQAAHGRQTHETIQLVAPHLNTPAELAALVKAEEDCREGVAAVAGAAALIAELPATSWAVVTSAWQRLAEIRLGCAGLPLPSVLITGEQVPRGKPHPDGYLAAAARLGVAASRCVVIEDSPVGIQAGRAAGMTVVGIATTFARDRLDCALCIDDFRGVRVRSTQ